MFFFTKIIMIPSLIFLCFCINIFSSHAADTISGNQALSRAENVISSADTISANRTLSGNQTIVSSGGNFELGFFSQGNFNKHYIGIWYKKITEQTIIWVANRDNPISDKNSAQLKISDGNLVLLNESRIEIWSTDLNPTNFSVTAVLLDSGNLVLRNASGSNSKNLWESFDNPTDTWIPGAKLGYDKRTKKKQTLISWKNSEDLGSGLFSREFDPNQGQFIAMWNMSKQYWNSGPWNSHTRTFDLVPEMGFGNTYNYSFIDNENESYFTYMTQDPSLIARSVFGVSGQLMSWWYVNTSWNLVYSQPRQQCDVYAYCGPFGTCNKNSLPFCSCLPGFKIKSENDWSLNDYSGGCVREIDLQCKHNASTEKSKDKFLMNPMTSLPVNSQSLVVGSIGECKLSCLSNCSCTAYAYDEKNECSLWNGELLDLQKLDDGEGVYSGKNIYVRLSASSSVFSSVDDDNKGVVIGAIVGSCGFVLVLLAIVLAVIWFRMRKARVSSKEALEGGSLMNFGYKDLQNATKNFSNKLGGGGFGCVYKGVLPDSTTVAVKKLESIGQIGEKQFRAEVETIGIIQHVNLVRLRGFCAKGSKKMLVYDFVENGSLDSHLFRASEVLHWKTRYQIAVGIARGLEYLHDKCRDCIIHCDVKPENILLDVEFCPKVGDFGLAKLMGRDFSRVLTTLRGTLGYLAPEWIAGVEVTAKADVYSYGMMLFELVSGKRNSRNTEEGENVEFFFPASASKTMIEGDDIMDLLDPLLKGDADVEEVTRMCRVACWCIQSDENIRPSMGQVVQILEGLMDVNLPPFPRWIKVLLAPN